MHATQTIRVTPNSSINNINGLSSSHSTGPGFIQSSPISSGLPVIVNPTQLVPVLPAASQSVVKRIVPAASLQQNPPPVIVKSEQGTVSHLCDIYIYNLKNSLYEFMYIGDELNVY